MFANLWGASETKMSKVQFSVRGDADVEVIMNEWFKDTMAADIRVFENVHRQYKNSSHLA